MLLKLLFISITFSLASVEGFYLSQEGTKAKFGSEVDIVIDQKDNADFPNEFKVRISGLNPKLVVFKKVEKGLEYPIAKGNIHTLVAGKIVTYNNEQDFEVYRERNGASFATLVRNENYIPNGLDHPFRMLGTIHERFSNYVYDIMPVLDTTASMQRMTANKKSKYDAKENKHTVLGRNEKNVRFIDEEAIKIKVEEARLAKRHNRAKRNDGKPLGTCVEVLVVTDISIFEDHKVFAQSNDTNLVFKHMRAYFAHLMNGVSFRYKQSFVTDPSFSVSVQLTNYLFLTSTSDSNWSNPLVNGVSGVPNFNGRDVILATNVLDSFKNFMNAQSLPFTWDHAAALTNKDIWSATSGTADVRSSTVGLAYLKGVCLDTRYSINEETGGFASIGVIAHEIGHNLGADHDGLPGDLTSPCPASDNFIMTPGIGSFQTNLANLLKFSSCSVNSFKALLLNDDQTAFSQQASCLTNSPPTNVEIDSYEGLITITAHTADDQCKQLFGPTASFCHGSSADMCETLACRTSNTDTSCRFTPGVGAVTGTICGSSAICQAGVCTTSQNVPASSCPFGDDVVISRVTIFTQNDLPSVQMTCEAAFNYGLTVLSRYFCGDSNFKSSCCEYCKRYEPVTCLDTIDCSTFGSFCNTGATLTIGGQSVNINTACPRTCGVCDSSALTCSNNICQNGGICVDDTNQTTNAAANVYIGYRCDCPTGYSGFSCEIINQCLFNPCQNGGTCINFGSNGYVCQCPINGCSGFNCTECGSTTTTTESTTTTTASTTATIASTTTTTESTTTTTASTVASTTTTTESTITTTTIASTTTTTASTTTTTASTTTTTASTTTTIASTTTTTASTTTTTASTTTKTASTTSLNPFITNVCSPNPCLNNGRCIQTGPTFATCECQPDFTGPTCEISNACFSNPCMNGGTCNPIFRPTSSSYQCTCPSGFRGRNCQVDLSLICSRDSCFNGGTCIINPTTGRSECKCTIFYTGSRCENRFNPCITNGQPTCQNMGRCTIDFGVSPYYRCKCRSGFTGNNCEVMLTTTTTTTVSTPQLLCEDEDPYSCQFYARQNYCSNRYYLGGRPLPIYCRLSCGTCTPAGTGTTTAKPCVDAQPSCQFWGSAGYCHLLPNQNLCAKSCGLCN